MTPLPRHKLRRTLPITLCVFLATLLVRLWVLNQLAASPLFIPDSGDMSFYNQWGLRIAHGTFTDHKAFYGLPGYPFMLGMVYAAAGYNPFVMGFLQAISEGLIAVLIYLLARAVVPAEGGSERGEFAGSLAALGWAFYLPAQTFAAVLMPTTWLVLSFWFVVYWIVSKKWQRGLWTWLAVGACVGLTATVVATILFLLPLLGAAALLRFEAKPLRKLAAISLVFAGVFTGSSPCWIHNYFVAGEPVMFSAHSGVNFWIGNNPRANGYPKIPPGLRAGQEGMLKDSITMAEKNVGHSLTRVEVSRYWSGEANNYIHEHFTDWLKLMCVKLGNFWNRFQYDDLSLISFFQEKGILTWGITFGVVAALAFPGVLIGIRRHRDSGWILSAVLLHMAALLPVFVTERYRLAAVPGLLLFAAIGLCHVWQALAQRNWRSSVAYGPALGMACVLVCLPVRDPGLWSLDYYNNGIKALEIGDIAAARTNLEMAYSYVAENSEINFALGNLHLASHERHQAKDFYRRVLRLKPTHDGALNNLGVMAIEEQRWALAARFLSASLASEPSDAKTCFLLATALLNSGELDAAAAAIRSALALKPDQHEFQELSHQIEQRRATKRF